MNAEIKKATYKTAISFFVLLFLLFILNTIFHFNEYIFDFHRSNLELFQSELWKNIIIFSSLIMASITGALGYIIAKNKKRNANNWAGICLFFNIWGLIFLAFLPTIEINQAQQGSAKRQPGHSGSENSGDLNSKQF